ncbi:MAG: hypothetical protein R3E44_13230 [Paracoccaceae bacterium]
MTKYIAERDAWTGEAVTGPQVGREVLRRKLECAARTMENVAYDLAGIIPAGSVAQLMILAAEIERHGIDGRRDACHRN